MGLLERNNFKRKFGGIIIQYFNQIVLQGIAAGKTLINNGIQV